MRLYRRDEEFGQALGNMYPFRLQDSYEEFAGRSITFQVTDACNLACSYCYQINKGKRYMPIETAKAFVDMLLSGEKGLAEYLDTEHVPGVVLDFIGGEPLLAMDVIDQTIDYFHERVLELNHPWKDKWRVCITSNGTLYDDEVKNFLRKHENHLFFTVTVDGNKKLHDTCRLFPDGTPSYDLAAGTVRDRMEQGYSIGNKLTISHENLPFLSEAIQDMVKDGHRALNANCVFEDAWQPGDSALYYQELKKLADYFLEDKRYEEMDCTLFSEIGFIPQDENYLQNCCGGTGMMLAMDPDGYLYPCLRYMESSVGDGQTPFRLGNVWEGFGTTPEERQRMKCLDCVDRRTQCSDECFYCPIGSGCSWCSALNYQCNGTPDQRTTYICEMHKARALANVYYWNKLYRQEEQTRRLYCWVPKEWALSIVSEDEYNALLELSDSQPMTIEEAYEESRRRAKLYG